MDIPTVVVTRAVSGRRAVADGNGNHAQGRGRRGDRHRHRPHPLDRHRWHVATTVIEFQLDRDVSKPSTTCATPSLASAPICPARSKSRSSRASRPTGGALLTFGIASQSMSEDELSWFVDLTVNRELSSIAGVGVVRRVGGVDREIRVDLDPDALNSLGTTAGDISRQLRRTQVELPGGEARVGNQEQSVRTVATAASVQDLADAAHHPAGRPHGAPRCHRAGARPGGRTAPARDARRQAHRRVRSDARRGAPARSGSPKASQRTRRQHAEALSAGHVHRGEQHRQLRARVLQGFDADAVRGRRSRDHRRVVLPAGLARDASISSIALAALGHAYFLGAALRVRLHDEHDDDAGAVAGGRHPRRRRDRRSREHRAAPAHTASRPSRRQTRP